MSLDSAKALIMVVSRPEAIDDAAAAADLKRIGVIISQDVVEPVVQRCIELSQNIKFSYRIVDSPMEIGDAFDRFERLLAELEREGYAAEEVVLDPTGGTTPMRLGAALAAITRGLRMVHRRFPMSYVAGEWKPDEGGEAEIVPMDNPLESTGLLREGQAVTLFDRRDYPAAALVLEDVVSKVSGVARRYYYEGLLRLARGYAAWDVADYGAALEELKRARESLGVGFAERELAERARTLTASINGHLPFLGKVRGRLSVENVVDMLENARRRIEDQGRYDDGVARLYRALEMWHQWRLLSSHSIDTSEVDWKKADETSRSRFLERTGLSELPRELDLSRARVLDEVLSGEEFAEDNTYRDLLQKRNHSILAHGLEPIGEAAARRFLEYVDSHVEEPEIIAAARHVRLGEA